MLTLFGDIGKLIDSQVEKVAQEIQALLKQKGLKQKDLAEHLGRSETSLSRLLKEETFKPDTMIKISQFLGVDLNFFNRDTNVKSVAPEPQEVYTKNRDDVEYLKAIIATKDEVIRSKDELIATLKEKLKK